VERISNQSEEPRKIRLPTSLATFASVFLNMVVSLVPSFPILSSPSEAPGAQLRILGALKIAVSPVQRLPTLPWQEISQKALQLGTEAKLSPTRNEASSFSLLGIQIVLSVMPKLFRLDVNLPVDRPRGLLRAVRFLPGRLKGPSILGNLTSSRALGRARREPLGTERLVLVKDRG
jgi:hypothetical protein